MLYLPENSKVFPEKLEEDNTHENVDSLQQQRCTYSTFTRIYQQKFARPT